MHLSGWGCPWGRCRCVGLNAGGSSRWRPCIVNIRREAYALSATTISAVAAPAVVAFVFPFIIIVFFILFWYRRCPISAPSIPSPVGPAVSVLDRLRSALLMVAASTGIILLDAAEDALLLCKELRIQDPLLAWVLLAWMECLLRSTRRNSLLLPMTLRL